MRVRVCQRQRPRLCAEREGGPVAKQNRGFRNRAGSVSDFRGENPRQKREDPPEFGMLEAHGLAVEPRCTGTRRLHSRRVRPARSLYRTHQRAQPSCKRIRAPWRAALQAGAPPPKPHGRTQPGGEQPQPAPSRPAQCCGSPAGFASPTRRVELAAGGVETTVAGAECSAARRAELERKRAWFRNQQEEKVRKRAAEAQRHKDRRRRVPIPRPPRPRASLSPSRVPPPPTPRSPCRAPQVKEELRRAAEGARVEGAMGGGRGGGGGRSGDAGGGSGWR